MMNKQLAAIGLSLIILFVFCACRNNGATSSQNADNSITINFNTSNNKNAIDLDAVEQEIELYYIKTYTQNYMNSSPSNFASVFAKNNSKYSVSLTVNVQFYNNGTLVDARNAYFDSFTTNEWYIQDVRTKESFTDIKLEITNIERKSSLDNYQLSDIVSVFDTLSGNKVLISASNKCDQEINLGGYVVFYKNDSVVYTDLFVCKMKAGKETVASVETPKEYTSYKVYFSHIRFE